MRVLGLMSGTSADGVDAVLVELKGSSARPLWQILARGHVAYPAGLARALIQLGQGLAQPAATILELGEALTLIQAEAARACDPGSRAQLVGCHGQTVWHRPPSGSGRRGASWQLLQGPLLAELLGTPVVYDFRAADLALGGQGAPLVPPTDLALLGPCEGWRAVLNLGGIANLTLIPPAGGPDRRRPLLGWDCGPANTLLDLAVHHFSEGRQSFDNGGQWAQQGTPSETLVQQWLREPYLQQAPPKSTGRELFGQHDLQRRLHQMAELGPADALATLTAFAAAAVVQELERGPRPLELLVAGGGARNANLMQQLRRRCYGTMLRPLSELGIGEQDREALAFALLAWWHWRRYPGNRPSVTGARRAAVLGVCARPARARGKAQDG